MHSWTMETDKLHIKVNAFVNYENLCNYNGNDNIYELVYNFLTVEDEFTERMVLKAYYQPLIEKTNLTATNY